MTSIFEQQQQMIQTISQNISKEKEQLDKLYGQFINGLEQNNPINNNYKSIDEILLSTISDAKDFYDDFKDYTDEICYWYDMNQKKFINKIFNYESKIIYEYDFDLYLEDDLFHDKSILGKMYIPLGKINKFDIKSCMSPPRLTDTNIVNNYYKNDIDQSNYKICGNSVHINVYISEHSAMKIKLCIDKNLNIIIPAIKTIIISNYSSFPLSALYLVYEDYLNMYETKIYNKFNNDDNTKFEIIRSIISEFTNYLTSKDQRDKFNNGSLFKDILNFMNYENIMKNIQEYLNFIASIKLQSTNETKVEIVNELELYKKDINIDELIHKNQSFEKLIMALETDNKKYITDISEYILLVDKYKGEIYTLQSSIIQYTEDIQKSKLDNLNQSRQLIELDLIKKQKLDLQKEIDGLNTSILQYQAKEQKISIEKQTLISKCSLQFEEINNFKKELAESRKKEKELTDEIISIKDLNKKVNTQLEERDALIQTLKDKITGLLEPKDEINTSSSYDSVLFEQIKELQGEIEKYKKQIESINKENEGITKKYNDMQNKMKSLLGI